MYIFLDLSELSNNVLLAGPVRLQVCAAPQFMQRHYPDPKA